MMYRINKVFSTSTSLVVLIFITGTFCSSTTMASPILVEVIETMMEAQAHDALFIGQFFGPDDTTVLDYTFDIDPVTRSSSYTLLPNQTFRVLPISLSSSGNFDANLGQYDWTTLGTLAIQNWTKTGTAVWMGDP